MSKNLFICKIFVYLKFVQSNHINKTQMNGAVNRTDQYFSDGAPDEH